MRPCRVRCAIALATAAILAIATPAGGALPLALLGKEIVKELVRALIEDAIHTTLMATLGPCDGALASGALSTLQGIATMRSPAVPAMPAAIPGLPGGMPALPPGAAAGMPGGGAGAIAATVGGAAMASGFGGLPLSGEARADDLPAFLRPMVQGMVDDQLRERREDQRKRGLTAEQIEAEDREQDRERREMLDALREMQAARPLSATEIDEFVQRYGRMASLMPDQGMCSPESLRRLLTLTPITAIPMAAGQIRTMSSALAEMDAQFAQARRTYAAMSPAEREEHVRLMTEEIDQWDDEPRRLFARMLDTDALGVPQDMRAALRARLDAR